MANKQVKPFLLWLDPVSKDLLEQIREKTLRTMTSFIRIMIQREAVKLKITARPELIAASLRKYKAKK